MSPGCCRLADSSIWAAQVWMTSSASPRALPRTHRSFFKHKRNNPQVGLSAGEIIHNRVALFQRYSSSLLTQLTAAVEVIQSKGVEDTAGFYLPVNTHTHSHFSDGEVQILEVGSSTVSSRWCLLASWIDWLIELIFSLVFQWNACDYKAHWSNPYFLIHFIWKILTLWFFVAVC